MLGIRAALKPDLECSAAELVYDTTLRIPGDLFGYSQSSVDLDPSDYVQRFRHAMTHFRATPPRPPTKGGTRVFLELGGGFVRGSLWSLFARVTLWLTPLFTINTGEYSHLYLRNEHKNSSAFKNNLHDTSKRTAAIRQVEMVGLCARCKDILDWKIKYKKYKPLTQPKSCIKCGQRTVKRAYYTICDSCAEGLKVCGKCGEAKDIVIPPPDSRQVEEEKFFEQNLRGMRERERRTLLRIMQSGDEEKMAKATERVKRATEAKDSNMPSSNEDSDGDDDDEEEDIGDGASDDENNDDSESVDDDDDEGECQGRKGKC
ncbi:hypothetical protein SprV_0902780500 [Sparganum proliferum]